MTRESTTKTMTTQYSFDRQALEQSIAAGESNIMVRFNVRGFWSDVIDVRVRREFRWNRETLSGAPDWAIDVSHSSGGMEGDIDSVEAHVNFGAAVLAAVDLARELKARLPEIVGHVLAAEARAAAAEQQAQAERQAKIDADPALGQDRAEALVDLLRASLRAGRPCQLVARQRGSDESKTYSAAMPGRSGTAVRFYYGPLRFGRRGAIDNMSLTRAELVSALAGASREAVIANTEEK